MFLDNEATLSISQSLKVAEQRERLDIFDDRVLLPLEKHILLMPLLFLVTVNSTEHDTTIKRKIGSAVARTIC